MKMNHLEIEFKTMLTKGEHDRLLQLFADISPISQTNYYIESDQQSIRHAHMAFRVRTFNHREAELTGIGRLFSRRASTSPH